MFDSSHKKINEEFNKKRTELDKKIKKINKLKNELENLDNQKNELTEIPNFIKLRVKLIENISNLEEEIKQINNYEDETEYYSKTYQILFNYYDLLDCQINNEINIETNNETETNNEIKFDKFLNNIQFHLHNYLFV